SADIHALKTFRLEPASYVLTLSASASVGDRVLPAAVLSGPEMGDIAEVTRGMQTAEGLLFVEGKVQRLAAKAIASQPSYEGEFRYAGVDDNYFIFAAISPGPAKIVFQPVTIPP